MRRGFPLAGAALVALLSTVVAPAPSHALRQGAVDERPRTELLLRIATLSDEAEAAQARVVGAQLHADRLRSSTRTLRQRVAERAVAAYISGGYGPVPPDAYNDIVAARQARLTAELKAARAELDRVTTDVELLADASAGPTAELATLHAELDRINAALAAARNAEQRAADEARRRAVDRALRNPSLTPRHKRATAAQAELMAKYPFGPLAPGTIPPGLVPSGEPRTHLASWYGPGFDGRATASGAIYDQEGWTVASPNLPLGTFLVVSRGDRSALLLVNDRGPYIPPRSLDLSHAAAVHLGVGVNEVVAQIVVPG